MYIFAAFPPIIPIMMLFPALFALHLDKKKIDRSVTSNINLLLIVLKENYYRVETEVRLTILQKLFSLFYQISVADKDRRPLMDICGCNIQKSLFSIRTITASMFSQEGQGGGFV